MKAVMWLCSSALVICLLFGCSPAGTSGTVAPAPAPTRQVFQVKGVVKELKPEERTVVVHHENIPDYMASMIMPFAVRDTNELTGLKVGDSISFRMVVTDKDGWIEEIAKLNTPVSLPTSQPETVRIVPNVDPLNEGDLLPEYRFTNELGQAVSTRQFRGQALALTFIFTSCPFPDYCPRLSNNFAEAAKKLKSMPNAPTNWHLFSISFDTRLDTPARLLGHAKMFNYDPAHWSFLAGKPEEIDTITEQFGLQFWRPDGTNLTHNLRTAVIDAQGRVQKIIFENKWTSDELVAELLKAAKPK